MRHGGPTLANEQWLLCQVPQLGKGRVMVQGSDAEKRMQMMQGVFREANPCSMTVEEWGEVEMQRMQEQQASCCLDHAAGRGAS